MISIKYVTHYYGKSQSLDSVNLEIKDGTIFGLVGVNGAGKSTLLRIMSGVYIPKYGNVSFDGLDPIHEEGRRNVFFLPDDPYYTSLTTCKELRKLYKTFYERFDDGLYYSLMSEFGLDEKKFLRTFSKGMRRQAYICLALAIRPKYLLLDEAFDGLDPLARKRVKLELIKMVEQEGATVVISSHALRELEDFCDSFAIIDGKKVKSTGDVADKVEKYCKFQLAFIDPIDQEAFKELPVISLEKSEKFVKVVLEGQSDEMRARLEALSPAIIEEMPMNFEEVFISEVGKELEL